MITVKATRYPGGTTHELLVDDNSTVSDVLSKAGIVPAPNEAVQMNALGVELSDRVVAGAVIIVSAGAKGN